MSSITGRAPFRCDIVGSFLRPEKLKKARSAFSRGLIGSAELKAVEDESILELVGKQKEMGLPVITDGEFRRSWWHLDFMWGLGGVERRETGEGYRFHDETTRAETALLTGRISGGRHPFIDHFAFVKAFADESVTARQTIPAPAQFLAEIERPENLKSTRALYPDDEELIRDIADAYRTVIADLYKAGCRNVQFDDCTWGLYCDSNFRKTVGMSDADVAKASERAVRVNNLAIEGHPADLAITTHVCRGNYHSTWAMSGGYDAVAPYLFSDEKVDAFYLEYDTERSGSFEPLRYVGEDKKVVLGLVTTKSPKLEEKKDIVARVKEAQKYLPLDRLCLSPQCGFASTEEGNLLTEDEQWAKIDLVREIARDIWR
jgi:5-methyltetrahydropteroyltriglutamate--homocysteine methyltransferase